MTAAIGEHRWTRKTPEDLDPQLLAPHPDIPPGVQLVDLRELLQWLAQMIAAMASLQRMRGLAPSVLSSPAVPIGAGALTVWEARHEIVRRAIDHLERR